MSLALPNDTHPKIHALQIEGYRRMSPSQKLECIWSMMRTARELVLLDIRRRHPHADAREQALRVASRFIEPEDDAARVRVGRSQGRILMLAEPARVVAVVARGDGQRADA